ncbi:hypothetical protein AU05_01830 [Ectopseudomonas composti]|uniref:Uncharacterized protein n=1 Tax=Ectopseudomonas composti TaxID=658457 RepID=A0ABN0SG95_9GAMM|nr:hypothetical protein AU05_01830 [Pseudomonas composti]
MSAPSYALQRAQTLLHAAIDLIGNAVAACTSRVARAKNGNTLVSSGRNWCAETSLKQSLRKCQTAGNAGKVAVTELGSNPCGDAAGIDHARMWIRDDWIDRCHARLHVAADDHVAITRLGYAHQHGYQDQYAAIPLHARHPLKGVAQ